MAICWQVQDMYNSLIWALYVSEVTYSLTLVLYFAVYKSIPFCCDGK